MKLSVELVPSTSWFKNLRSMLAPEEWDRLRRKTYREADYRCEICDGQGPDHPVECHEIWHYDDKQHGLKIFTMEGPLMATVGDWIIKGVKGEVYPCKPDIFVMTYEPEQQAV